METVKKINGVTCVKYNPSALEKIENVGKGFRAKKRIEDKMKKENRKLTYAESIDLQNRVEYLENNFNYE